ncbi:MAG: CPBP family intramembrane metalloprotease [Candidatus Marinimicrobia bacterium]|nr:CPBP family intramembrane metalloprotease [Candidatus Neomarinimicrobiota bacterium]MBL7022716.1 CPBP family intramembrane metalloprotease [Candidatus Neomarinimicrobiota bacterium]MBL7109155.1 CPBP family intramembrane metalloprotease [Candidatus Neomarinimicrobiota bacterium]
MNLNYSRSSSSILYGITLVFPLMIVYELLGIYINWNAPYELRNGADALIREFFLVFGQYSQIAYGIALFVLLSIIAIKYRHLLTNGQMKIHYLMLMIAESILWGFFLFVLLSRTGQWMMAIPFGGRIVEELYLSIGAGIYEELLFRLTLIFVLTLIFHKILRLPTHLSGFIAVLFSAILFAMFHYIGTFGDVFRWNTFIVRIVAGLFLGLLFIFRGFGITAYTHIIYDVIVVCYPLYFARN